MDIKFRVEFPSEFLPGRRQTGFTDESTFTRAVTMISSPSGTGGLQSPDVLAVLKLSYTSFQERKSEFLPLP